VSRKRGPGPGRDILLPAAFSPAGASGRFGLYEGSEGGGDGGGAQEFPAAIWLAGGGAARSLRARAVAAPPVHHPSEESDGLVEEKKGKENGADAEDQHRETVG
jgi:hypothetical protein